MLTAALVDPGQLVALVIGLCGLAGVVFTALKYNRDDAGAIVEQQSALVGDMKVLTDELRHSEASLRGQLEDCLGRRG